MFFKKRFAVPFAIIIAGLCASQANAQLIFNFAPDAGTPANVIAGFQQAAARWSALFVDPIQVNINIGFPSLGAGILGQSGDTTSNFTYTQVRTALTGDRTSSDDFSAVSHLQAGSAVSLLINRTSDNPNGSGSATPYLDTAGNNNTTIKMSTANAKALGLIAGAAAALDATIDFSSNFSWDFDPSNGIDADKYDFVGVATHEIGHALGFISGVDVLDGNSPPFNGPFLADQFTFVSTLDLYRYSAQSVGLGNGIIDWTADARGKYFSVDGGTTAGALFADGTNFGDGRQASHWKDDLGLGIMDPTAANGELMAIGPNDIRALDVVGYNLASASVPEPSSFVLGIALLTALAAIVRRKASA
jgi:hypothetical protein